MDKNDMLEHIDNVLTHIEQRRRRAKKIVGTTAAAAAMAFALDGCLYAAPEYGAPLYGIEAGIEDGSNQDSSSVDVD